MRIIPVPLRTAAFAVLLLAGVGSAQAGVTVAYDNPADFTDAKLFDGFGKVDKFVLKDLGRHLDKLGARYLPADQALKIEVLPEIEVPAHSHGTVKALPGLRDPGDNGEEASVQGYIDNIVNPAMPATWEVLQPLTEDVAALSPLGMIRLGASSTPRWIMPKGTSAATSSQASSLRDAMITSAPCSANARLIARPRPRLPPVTSATLPVMSNRLVVMVWGLRGSTAGEVGLALFHERLHAFLEIVRLEQRQQLQVDMMDMVVEGFVGRHPHHPLGALHRHRRVGDDLGGQRARGGQALVGRHHLRHQPHVADEVALRAVGHRDPGTLLSAVLQREEAEKGDAGNVVAGSVDPEDATAIANGIVVKVIEESVFGHG